MISTMNRKETIEAVAEYFTGPHVVHSSIGLQIGGTSTKMAKLFFDTREKLGIKGYATKEEAEAALIDNLAE
jgi:hypothetical protein